MKKVLPIIVVVVVVAIIVAVKMMKPPPTEAETTVEPIVWYGMAPHPYINEVQIGAKAAEKDYGVKILCVVGQEWTQDNENSNIKSYSTKGHKGFSIYPGDPAGANGLFGQLKRNNQLVVAYGAEPNLPTPAGVTVATDIQGAAEFAAEELVKLMGGKGNILNVLETVTDLNTKKRDDGINKIADKHADVKVIQTISDMTQVSVAKEKIQSALAARGAEIDGIITTGYNPTIAAAAVLTEWHKDPSHKRIRFVGIDTGETVLEAIRNGSIDATVAQNPFGHGYISCSALKLMLDGWTVKDGYQFINAGMLLVTKDNVDTYAKGVKAITDGIMAELKTKYLVAPKKAAGE